MFYAKILLFGEYGIIEDSMGLTIPYNYYEGKLKMDGNPDASQKSSNDELKNYCLHLAELHERNELPFEMDIDRFKDDITKGLYFDSTIPQGFGVGSSGALCAALYDKYGKNKITASDNIGKNEILKLKSTFGFMENYFHGKSSGIDPLICYLNIPLLIKSKSDVGTVGLPDEAPGEGAIFLLDSGQPGETEPMVNIFMEKCKQQGFRKMLKEQFVKYNDECIKSFLDMNFKQLFRSLKHLSGLLLENFTPMIPTMFHKLWKEGLETNAYYLKLCGSGGGGYILGFTRDVKKAQQLLKDHDMEIIYRF